MKVLFNGFRHGHIFALYNMAKNNSNVEIVACIERDENARKAAEDRLGIKFDDRDLDYWLKQDVDVVAVGSCFGHRGEVIIKALSAGKHIISDKPICTSKTELEIISKLIEQKNLKLGCMLDLRYLSPSIAVKNLLKTGELGEVCNISFTGQHCLDYQNRPSWYFEKNMQGGTINDLAIHGVDLVTYLTGLTVKNINSARTWNCYADKAPDFKDCALFMAELDNKAGLIADVSYSSPKLPFTLPTYWNFKIWCKKGLITFNLIDNYAYIYKENCAEAEKITAEVTNNYLDDFINEIKNDTNCFTQSVLLSSKQCLDIQYFADKE